MWPPTYSTLCTLIPPPSTSHIFTLSLGTSYVFTLFKLPPRGGSEKTQVSSQYGAHVSLDHQPQSAVTRVVLLPLEWHSRHYTLWFGLQTHMCTCLPAYLCLFSSQHRKEWKHRTRSTGVEVGDFRGAERAYRNLMGNPLNIYVLTLFCIEEGSCHPTFNGGLNWWWW